VYIVLSIMKDEAAKLKTKQTIAETQKRRSNMSCKVIQTKIDLSSLSKQNLNHLHKLFIEAKWLYNDILSSDNIREYDTKNKKVQVKVGEIFESRNLDVISGQMRQSIQSRLFTNMQSLNALKKKGFKIGKLKFKSQVNSIPLKQLKATFDILKNQSRIRIQGIKKPLKVNGLNQIPDDAEIACATLKKSGKDFFIHITFFIPKQDSINVPNRAIGIDFGCSSQLTLSNGLKIEYGIHPSKRIRKLDKKIARSKKKSKDMTKNRQDLLIQRESAYSKDNNKKKDIRNKIVNTLTKNYKYIAFQDDNFRGWQGNHGKKMNGTALGSLKTALKNKTVIPMVVGKWYPSSQLCSGKNCKHRHKMDLKDRTYVCPECGLSIDRDLNAAENILKEGMRLNKIPTERRESKPMEILSSALTDEFERISHVIVRRCH
jgi:putative transposase